MQFILNMLRYLVFVLPSFGFCMEEVSLTNIGTQRFQSATNKILEMRKVLSLSDQQDMLHKDLELLSMISATDISHIDLKDSNADAYKGISENIDKEIVRYIGLPKTDYETLPQRLSCLLEICKLSYDKSKSIDSCPERLSALFTCKALFSLAAAKHNYIAHMFKYLKIFYDDKSRAIPKFVGEFFVFPKGKQCLFMKHLKHFAHALDPYHSIDTIDKEIRPEVDEWEASDTKLPFTLWLEGRDRKSSSLKGEVHVMRLPDLKDFAASVSENKQYDIVVDINNEVKLTPSTRGSGRKHIGLSGGKPVIFAGEIEFGEGQVLQINNHSGHFKPNHAQFEEFVNLLKKIKVLPNDATIAPSCPGMPTRFSAKVRLSEDSS
ncbi:MAG: hypothetical protein LBS23_00940 [Holosporaceae bacterium]|jgi:hypothetical protein|nr:hypothetical protein [Holosporaceae bacterium]